MLFQKPYLTPPRSSPKWIDQDDITWVRHSSPNSERKSLIPLVITPPPPIVREQEKIFQTYILISRWNLWIESKIMRNSSRELKWRNRDFFFPPNGKKYQCFGATNLWISHIAITTYHTTYLSSCQKSKVACPPATSQNVISQELASKRWWWW